MKFKENEYLIEITQYIHKTYQEHYCWKRRNANLRCDRFFWSRNRVLSWIDHKILYSVW